MGDINGLALVGFEIEENLHRVGRLEALPPRGERGGFEEEEKRGGEARGDGAPGGKHGGRAHMCHPHRHISPL